MFKAKRIDNGKTYTVLSVYCEPPCHSTYFLIWENYGWRWRDANKFIPPNITIEEYNEAYEKPPF